MPDFSVTFNIVFTAALGMLALFFFGALVGVAAKGKRKCGGFDVFLRIFSAVCFAASVALLFVAVLTKTPEGFRISLGENTATLDAFGAEVDISSLYPVVLLMSAGLVATLVAALFALSLAALIVDCNVANKKTVKPKVTNSAKTPEQRRIAAELAKIRAIGDSAVRRTSAVAEENAAKTDAERSEKPIKKQAPVQAEKPVHTETPAHSDTTEQIPEKPASTDYGNGGVFVGLHDNNDSDPDFDTFDSFDSFVEEEKAAAASDEYETFDSVDEFTQTEPEPEPAEDFTRSTSEATDDTAYSERAYDEPEPETYADGYDEQTYGDEEAYEDGEQEGENYDDGQGDESESETYADEDDFAAPEQEEREDIGYDDDEAFSQGDATEPDRNIYFPKTRVITRRAPEPAAKKSASPRSPQKSGGTSASTSKPASKPAAKPAAKKPQAPTGRARKASESGAPDRKLPVNRRYVILDRRNVVNMFGEYLKERDGEDKDKLRSSINTIIIK